MQTFSTRKFCIPQLTFVALALGLSASVPVAAGDTGYWAKGRILVETRAGLADAELKKVLSPHGGRLARGMRNIQMHVVEIPISADERTTVELLRKNPLIKSAEVDRLVAPDQVGNDTYYTSAWHLPKIQAPTAWDSSLATGVTIAILDSGVDGTHPDLSGKMVPGWNFYDKNANTADVYGHGTKVAGSAAAASNNGLGVTGVAWNAKIMPVRISDVNGYAYWSTIAEGLYWAADNGAKVANISYAVQGSVTIQNAANYMRSKGGIVVNSAGNTGVLVSAAANAALISVSATEGNDLRASWSSFGDYVDVSAPGAGIWTTTRGGGYAAVSGTSFASPVTAGVIALMMSAKPTLKPAEIESMLKSTVVDLGAAGVDREFGSGRINAAAAVAKAKGGNAAAPAVDVTLPATAITAPGASTVNGIVTVNVNATDNVGVTKVDLYANGALVATDVTPAYSFSWDSTKVANGSANLLAKSYDAAGNVGTSATVTVNISNVVAPPPPVATEIILDNAAMGVQDSAGGRTFAGTWCQSTATNSYIGASLYSCGTTAESYRWTPKIQVAGNYDVYVWWSTHANRSTSVPISVTSNSGAVTKNFNQQTGGGQWVLLGRHNFSVGSAGFVEVKASNGQACADAVRLVPAP